MISIVIPIYNASQYLHRCINCILKQTYGDFEMLLIDDGSTDDSSKICDYYTRIDNRVRVIHQENKGVSVSRNRGIKEARGEYISFVDADDYVDKDYLTSFAEEIREGKSDLCIQGYNSTGIGNCSIPYSHEIGWNDICTKAVALNEHHLLGYVWNKLFRKDIIRSNHIQFNASVSLREDFVFVMQYLLHCNDMVVLPYAGYHYHDAIAHHYSFAKFNQSLDITFDLLSKIDSFPDGVRNYFFMQEYWLSLYVIHVLYRENHKKAERINYLKKIKARFEGYKNEKGLPDRVYVILSYMIQHLPLFLNDLIFTFRYVKKVRI